MKRILFSLIFSSFLLGLCFALVVYIVVTGRAYPQLVTGIGVGVISIITMISSLKKLPLKGNEK